KIAKMILHWVRLIAGPFLFFSVILSLLQIQTRWSTGLKLIFLALFNTGMALIIGISMTLLFLTDIQLTLPQQSSVETPTAQLTAEGWLQTLSPESLFSPLVKNEILLIALLALALAIAIRQAFSDKPDLLKKTADVFEAFRLVLEQILLWILKIIPLAVFFVIAGSVSQYGFSIFSDLAKYVAVVITALTLQCALVYGTWIFAIAKIPLARFWQEAKRPLIYSLGINSSLATLPITLKALKNLKVSDASASLGAGVATNLNNDGIVLYEATAVFFIAQLHGLHWDLGQMITAALACVVAAMGITGVPEAGFISLTVVVTSLGLPMEALPLLLSVDWVMARLRSAVNVLSDMTLSIALDYFEK
ncbi:dicarboxylate/amino acid:cation symporter, partial [bacterium]|nr:dicarboxylate/amino acid:cation symporter [bacterium]